MLTNTNKGEKSMVSKALEEYLKTMYVLKKQNGKIRVTDVAKKMNCSKASVNKALYSLKDNQLVNYQSYGTIELTQEGENLAKKVLEAYDIVYLFLKEVVSFNGPLDTTKNYLRKLSLRDCLLRLACVHVYGELL